MTSSLRKLVRSRWFPQLHEFLDISHKIMSEDATPAPFVLHAEKDRIVINDRKGRSLIINRASGRIEEARAEQGAATGGQTIHGLIGMIKLLGGKYLIVIKSCVVVGSIEGSQVFRMTASKIIPLVEAPLSGTHAGDELQYLKLLEAHLSTPYFYFSHQFDVTNTAQRRYTLPEAMEWSHEKAKPLWERADSRFFWNKHLLKDIISHELHQWVLPVMMGFIEIKTINHNGRSFDVALISRRSVKRVGTRFNRRGIDKEGNVANCVETEQLLMCEPGRLLSFVQLRGSIPVFWQQIASTKYSPKLMLTAPDHVAAPAFKRHFDHLVSLYNKPVVSVNLINQKGSEGLLHHAYQMHVRKFNTAIQDNSAQPVPAPVKYVHFDFHHQCAKMKYENLGLLLKEVHAELELIGYFDLDVKDVVSQQSGLIRTNCIDNLDRTNVVQTMFARHVLTTQLRKIGIFSKDEKVETCQALDQIFKHMWADNADTISLQYSGTGALKNDFTRTGKRNLRGALNDGINSLTRYYLNNFADGFRQDAYDLFVGNWLVDPSKESPFARASGRLWYLSVLLLALIMLFMVMFFPSNEASFSWKLMFISFWTACLYVVWKFLLKNGSKLVNHPRLIPHPTVHTTV